jgi:arylsulfatase A-like enzyme
MIDHWFGDIVGALDDRGLWDTTAVIVCTDHGHYLGEKDIWGKPGVMQYEPLGHIPLLIHWPGVQGGTTCDALTTAVDLHATIADAFDVEPRQPAHGTSLRSLIAGEASSVREWAIGGVYGNWVQITDGRRKYARGAAGDNFPLSMWSNRWSTMPIHGIDEALLLPRPDKRARLDFMPGSAIPVIRQPFDPGDRLPFWAGQLCVDAHHLYDVDADPAEADDLAGSHLEAEMIEMLRAALDDLHAPDDQYSRLGLS